MYAIYGVLYLLLSCHWKESSRFFFLVFFFLNYCKLQYSKYPQWKMELFLCVLLKKGSRYQHCLELDFFFLGGSDKGTIVGWHFRQLTSSITWKDVQVCSPN